MMQGVFKSVMGKLIFRKLFYRNIRINKAEILVNNMIKFYIHIVYKCRLAIFTNN
jgi:hypothetical protein